MKEISNQDLKSIMEASSEPMVSIYLSRDHEMLDVRSLNDKWKSSLAKVEFYLLKDYKKSFVDSFMEPLKALHLVETLEHADKGLIVFFSHKEQGYLRVQTQINDLVVVADSFHIKPLLRIKNNERGFFLVNISKKIIHVSVETNGHLYNMDTYKNTFEDIETNKHTDQDPKDFYKQTASELHKALASQKLPIILAGVTEQIGNMKKYFHHPYLIENGIVGNVETWKADELREACFKILEPYYHLKEMEAVSDLNSAIKKNQAITYIEDIAVSAVYGKIRKLFVVENRQLWGTFNKVTGEILISPKQINARDDDILDDICQMVLKKGGDVVVLKDAAHVKGYIAAAIVTDNSHLYDYSGSTITG